MRELFEEIVVRTTPGEQTREVTKRKRQPPYMVILHNDDTNGFGFVVDVLRRVFGYGTPRAFRLTLLAHLRGRSTVWTGVFEVAEFKAEQMRGCGPDPAQARAGAAPLRVTLEPLAVD